MGAFSSASVDTNHPGRERSEAQTQALLLETQYRGSRAHLTPTDNYQSSSQLRVAPGNPGGDVRTWAHMFMAKTAPRQLLRVI